MRFKLPMDWKRRREKRDGERRTAVLCVPMSWCWPSMKVEHVEVDPCLSGNSASDASSSGCFQQIVSWSTRKPKEVKWLWLQKPVHKWNPGKWKHGPKPAYPPLFNFEPHPNGTFQHNSWPCTHAPSAAHLLLALRVPHP